MAFGFDGFRIGEEIGKGLARPIDLSQATHYMMQLDMHQKELHHSMLQTLAKNMDSFNPKGVMRQDMPVVIDKYDRWRQLETEHPEASFNPRSPYYKEIDDARKDLYSTTANLIAGAKQMQEIAKELVTTNLQGRRLSDEGMKRWEYLSKNGVNAYINKYPDDPEFSSTILGDISQTPKQIATTITQSLNVGKRSNVMVDNGNGIEDTYSIPESGYPSLINEAKTKWEAMGNGSDAQMAITHTYNSMQPSDKYDLETELHNLYDIAGDKVVPKSMKKYVDNFHIDSPEKLHTANLLIQAAPINNKQTQSVSSKVNIQLAKMQQTQRNEDRNFKARMEGIGLSVERLRGGMAFKFFQNAMKNAKNVVSVPNTDTADQYDSAINNEIVNQLKEEKKQWMSDPILKNYIPDINQYINGTKKLFKSGETVNPYGGFNIGFGSSGTQPGSMTMPSDSQQVNHNSTINVFKSY